MNFVEIFCFGFFIRNEELVAKLNMCKEEYTQKCYEIRNLQKQLATMKLSGEVTSGSNEAIESVMQELENRREKCQELEEKNAKFEALNLSLEERVLIAEQMKEELEEEKLSSEEKYDSSIKERDEQITELTQQLLQLNEELASIQEANATKAQQMNNAIQSLRLQIDDKDKEIVALKNGPTPLPNYPHNNSTQRRGQLVVSTSPMPPMPPAQNRPPPAPTNNTKECPMCQMKFPASFGNAEFEAHVQSHFEY